MTSQNPETELMLEGDEDAVSLLQEKEMDNLGGKSAHQHLRPTPDLSSLYCSTERGNFVHCLILYYYYISCVFEFTGCFLQFTIDVVLDSVF